MYQNMKLKILLQKHKGYSASDLANLAKTACVEPINEMQSATHFKYEGTQTHVFTFFLNVEKKCV